MNIHDKQEFQMELMSIDASIERTKLIVSALSAKEQTLPKNIEFKKRCKINNIVLEHKNMLMKLMRKRMELLMKYN
jgi:hypothetical protein